MAAKKGAELKGQLTFRVAAVFFGLSALSELLSPGSTVVLFGEARSGLPAVVYHLLYAVLFAGLTLGLWQPRRWGYSLLLGATAFYTVDRVLYLAFPESREVDLALTLKPYQELLPPLDHPMLLYLMALATLVSVLCWWGFVAYAFLRLNYFEVGSQRREQGLK